MIISQLWLFLQNIAGFFRTSRLDDRQTDRIEYPFYFTFLNSYPFHSRHIFPIPSVQKAICEIAPRRKRGFLFSNRDSRREERFGMGARGPWSLGLGRAYSTWTEVAGNIVKKWGSRPILSHSVSGWHRSISCRARFSCLECENSAEEKIS